MDIKERIIEGAANLFKIYGIRSGHNGFTCSPSGYFKENYL